MPSCALSLGVPPAQRSHPGRGGGGKAGTEFRGPWAGAAVSAVAGIPALCVEGAGGRGGSEAPGEA